MRHNPNEPLARQRFVQQFVDLLRSDNATLFIGAGLSRACGLPSWVELMATPIKMLYGNKISPSDIDTLDFYDIADKFEQIHNRASLEDILKHHFSINPEDYKPHVNHRILTRLPIQRIWTTNYDKVIEKALYDEGKKVTVIKSDNDFSNSVTEDVKLYKIHGCIDMPREIVITKSDVFQYYRNYEVMNSNFFSSLAEDTFLFLGFGFADANLKTIIGRLFANYKSTGRPHYAVLKAPDPKNELESHKFDLTINDLAKFNIRTIAVKDYYEITTLLKDIEKQYIRRNIFISGSHHNFMHHKIFDPNNYAYDLSNYLKESTANAESKNKSDQPEYQQEDSQESFDHQQSELYQKARIQKLLMGPEIHKKQPKSNYLLKLTKRTEEYYKEEFSSDEMNRHLKKLLQNIGEQIFLDKDEAFSFYSGYGDGVADMILSGITKKIEQAQIKAFYSFPRIKILPLPHFERRSHDFNNPSYFKSLIQPCGTMVIAKGTMYASDLESGTFEEYHIAKGMSNVLKREQKELYLKILRELNIDLTTSASPKMDVEHWKKIFNLKQPTDEQTEARKNEISKLLCDKIEHQSRIIFYKLDELIGIFKVLVREEWKLTLRTLEESAAKIAVRIDQHLQDNINTKPRGNKHLQIINKNKFIGSEIKLLIFEMTNYFFDDFQPTKVYQFKSKQDSKTFKLTTQIEKVKTVFDQCIKFEEDLMSTKSNSEALPSNCRAILKILEEIRHLLQGHYKYLKIESIGSEFEKLEIQFSAATIQLISHLSKEDALHNEDIAVQLDKRQGIYECYESAFINLVKQTYNEAKPIEKSKKEYKVLEYNLDNLWKRSIQAMIMKDSNMYKMFCSKGELKSDEKILQTIRTFTEQYAHNDFLDSLLNEHAQTIHEHTRKKTNDPNKKSLDNIEMFKRSHISIYRIQLYKYFHVLSDISYGLSRLENVASLSEIKRYKNKGLLNAKNFWKINQDKENGQSSQTEEKMTPNVIEKITKPDNDDYENNAFIKFIPFMYNPNRLNKYLNAQRKYLDYYERNIEILSRMIDVKHGMTYIKDTILPSNKPEKKSISVYNSQINNLIDGFNFVHKKINEIEAIDGRKELSIKVEPHRTASVILPIGYYGAMSKKIWELERLRFELLTEHRKMDKNCRFEALEHFYTLHFGAYNPDPIKDTTKENINETKRKSDRHEAHSQQMIETSLIWLIKEFAEVPASMLGENLS